MSIFVFGALCHGTEARIVGNSYRMTPDKAHETVNWQELPGNRANALTVD